MLPLDLYKLIQQSQAPDVIIFSQTEKIYPLPNYSCIIWYGYIFYYKKNIIRRQVPVTKMFSDNFLLPLDLYLVIPDFVQIEQLFLVKSSFPDDSALSLLILPNRDRNLEEDLKYTDDIRMY